MLCRTRRPLFQALRFGVTAGGWTLGMIYPSSNPPAQTSTQLTRYYSPNSYVSFAVPVLLDFSAQVLGRYIPLVTICSKARPQCSSEPPVLGALKIAATPAQISCALISYAVGTVPPSITYSVPVMVAARSEERKAIRLAISAGFEGRPMGYPLGCP